MKSNVFFDGVSEDDTQEMLPPEAPSEVINPGVQRTGLSIIEAMSFALEHNEYVVQFEGVTYPVSLLDVIKSPNLTGYKIITKGWELVPRLMSFTEILPYIKKGDAVWRWNRRAEGNGLYYRLDVVHDIVTLYDNCKFITNKLRLEDYEAVDWFVCRADQK